MKGVVVPQLTLLARDSTTIANTGIHGGLPYTAPSQHTMFVKGSNMGHKKVGAHTRKDPPTVLGKLYDTKTKSIISVKVVIIEDVTGKGVAAPQLTLLDLDSTVASCLEKKTSSPATTPTSLYMARSWVLSLCTLYSSTRETAPASYSSQSKPIVSDLKTVCSHINL